MPCHNPAGTAAASGLRFSGDLDADHAAARAFADPARPADSALVTKGAGVEHGGGSIYPADSEPSMTIVAWIAAGAWPKPPAPPAPVAGESAASPAGVAGASALSAAPVAPVSPPVSPAVPPSPPPAPGPAGAHRGLGLPLGFHLNGRFDLSYERRGLGRDTDWDGGRNTLRSYHQFLFLTRPASEDIPVSLSVELINLQIWEASFAHRFAAVPLSLVVRAGKLLVPFGAEPLFHQLHGGLAGFDQRVLAPVWAQEGLTEQLLAHLGPLSISSDLYLVRGYRLRSPDDVLNLQNDFSALDEAKLGAGHRLGLAWRRLAAWHSMYFNPLGGGRRLLMQAVDVTSGRWRDVPVVGRFAASVGFLRADVSGGGAGRDYYHFASYWQARFYTCDGFYLQYRQGVRAFNNRRGSIVDETRLEANDGSTHTVGAVTRWRGLSAGLHYYFNLEKANEVDDDFFRAVAALEF